MHPGKHRAHAANHPRANETITQEFRRTLDKKTQHSNLTYARLEDLAYCLRDLFAKIDSLQKSVDLLNGDIQQIQADLNR